MSHTEGKYIGHTPGPWRWELNEKSRSVQIVGGFIEAGERDE